MMRTSDCLNNDRKKILHDPRTWLVLLAFCEKNIVRYGLLVLTMITGNPFISDGVLCLAYVFLIIECIRKGSRFSIKDIFLLVSVVVAILFTCVLYPENSKFIFDENNFWNSIFPCLRFFIVGLFVIPDKKLSDLLGVISCFSVLIEAVFLFAYLKPSGLIESDDMSRSYQILLNVLFVLNTTFNKKSLLWIGLSSVSLLYVLSLGTRGPIMILLAFIFLKILQVSSSKKHVKILIGLIAGSIIWFLSNSKVYLSILRFLKSFLDQLGMSTRIIDLAIEGEVIGHTSGRDEIYDLALEKISERPILGYGVYGEWSWNGWNIHNIYLELLLHYGIIIGSILIIWMIGLTLNTYFKTKNITSKEFIIMWSTCVYVRGIFGGSYLQFYLFLLLGFLFSETRRLKYY